MMANSSATDTSRACSPTRPTSLPSSLLSVPFFYEPQKRIDRKRKVWLVYFNEKKYIIKMIRKLQLARESNHPCLLHRRQFCPTWVILPFNSYDFEWKICILYFNKITLRLLANNNCFHSKLQTLLLLALSGRDPNPSSSSSIAEKNIQNQHFVTFFFFYRLLGFSD